MTSSKWFNCNACSLTHVTTSILAGLEVVQVHIVTAAFGDCSFGIDSDTLADRVRHYGKALAELIYKAKYEGIVLDLGADKEYARYFCGFVVSSQQRLIPKASFPGVIVVGKGKEVAGSGNNAPLEPCGKHRWVRSMKNQSAARLARILVQVHIDGLSQGSVLGFFHLLPLGGNIEAATFRPFDIEHTERRKQLRLRGEAGGRDMRNLGETGEFLSYLFYVIGCVLGGFFDEERVERYLPAINHMFVYGSFSLVLEPTHQVFLFLTRGGGCMERMAVTRLCGSSPSSPRVGGDAIPDGDTATGSASTDTGSRTVPASNLGKPQPQLRLHWDRALELSATAFFCAAGVFGGFPPHPSLALPGVYFWEVGSLFSVARSVLLIRRRGRGLRLRLRRLGAAADAEDGAL